MKYVNGNVVVSKSDCKAVRTIMGFNPDLRVKLGDKVVAVSYMEASIVIKVMVENNLWHYCNGDELTDIINNNITLFNISEKCLRGEYEYE